MTENLSLLAKSELFSGGAYTASEATRSTMHSSLLLPVLLALAVRVHGEVHQYHEDYFFAVADAYMFDGGHEAMGGSSREVS